MKRIEAARALASVTDAHDLFIGSVGAIRNDWWNSRPGREDGIHNTFSPAILGSITPTALGLALAKPDRRVVAIDTDGSMLMNLGVLCTLGRETPPNLTVVVLDNEIYECAGGMPTHTSAGTDIAAMAEAAGCPNCSRVGDPASLADRAAELLTDGELGLVVAKIEPGMEKWSEAEQRPFDGIEDKYRFLDYVRAG